MLHPLSLSDVATRTSAAVPQDLSPLWRPDHVDSTSISSSSGPKVMLSMCLARTASLSALICHVKINAMLQYRLHYLLPGDCS